MKACTFAMSAAALALSFATAANAGDGANAYAALKSLDGVWIGKVSSDAPETGFDGVNLKVKMHVTSIGHAIVHEMREASAPETPDHMGDITIFYLIGERIFADHFCDADNQPRMEAVAAADPKSIAFQFTGVTGDLKMGYIHDAAFKLLAPDHHAEDWTYIFPGNKAVHVHFDLMRAKP